MNSSIRVAKREAQSYTFPFMSPFIIPTSEKEMSDALLDPVSLLFTTSIRHFQWPSLISDFRNPLPLKVPIRASFCCCTWSLHTNYTSCNFLSLSIFLSLLSIFFHPCVVPGMPNTLVKSAGRNDTTTSYPKYGTELLWECLSYASIMIHKMPSKSRIQKTGIQIAHSTCAFWMLALTRWVSGFLFHHFLQSNHSTLQMLHSAMLSAPPADSVLWPFTCPCPFYVAMLQKALPAHLDS